MARLTTSYGWVPAGSLPGTTSPLVSVSTMKAQCQAIVGAAAMERERRKAAQAAVGPACLKLRGESGRLHFAELARRVSRFPSRQGLFVSCLVPFVIFPGLCSMEVVHVFPRADLRSRCAS